MPSRIGETFGSYKLVQFLGRGGFAEVYLGQHTQLPQQMAAIKILEKQLIMAKSQQFQKEASIVATLRHPNIVQMYDYNVYSNPEFTSTLVPYIVMEYAPNKSLRVKHPRGTTLPLRTILTYTRQIADALQYAHDQSVMHLDVKPENILINAQNKLLLSDFGLATLLTEEEKTGDVEGTLSYMSPEQLDGKPGFASDQYALAIMVYEWLCGHLPFTGHSVKEVIEQHLKAPPPPLRAQVALPIQAEDALVKALAKNPGERFPSIEIFAETFTQAVSQARGKAPAVRSDKRALSLARALPDAQSAPGPSAVPSAHPAPLPPAVRPGNAPEPAPVYSHSPAVPGSTHQDGSARQAASLNPPSLPGVASQAVPVNQAVPLTPPGLEPFQAAVPPGHVSPATPPLPSALGAGTVRAEQGLAPLAFAAGGNGASSQNAGNSPFLPGPPPGMQTPGSQQNAGRGPFLHTMPSSPSATTIFAQPGLGSLPGAGPLPPYLAGNAATGSHAATDTGQQSLTATLQGFLQRPSRTERRRSQPLLLVGLVANLLGAIFIGLWLARILPSPENSNETGWWGFIFASLISSGGAVTFFNSGNRKLNSGLALVLALYWGFVGHAFGILTSGSFLPDQNILAFLFFIISLVLHLYLTFKRR